LRNIAQSKLVQSKLGPFLGALPSPEVVRNVAQAVAQRAGARVIDRAIRGLGIGQHGVRLTGSLTDEPVEFWEAEVGGGSPALIAEGADVLVRRAMGTTFDLLGGEQVLIESVSIKWLKAIPAFGVSIDARAGEARKILLRLDWTGLDRERFRRDVLSNLVEGASAAFMVIGSNRDGLRVVEVELEVRAIARPQISNPVSNSV
jgi:hypothetical protein